MNTKKQNKHPVLSSFTVVCGLMYIFAYQFKLPFESDVFLYGMALATLAMNFLDGSITLKESFLPFILVAVASFLGVTYTTMPSEGLREAILFAFFACLFIFSYSKRNLTQLFIKWVYYVSIVVVLSSIIQFIFPEWFNDLMQQFMKDDPYERLMWSFEVDNTFAGLCAYTPNTTFSAAIVFGISFLNIADKKEKPIWKNQLLNLALIAISVFSIVICSKRGIFVAAFAGFAVLMFYLYIGKNFVFKFIGCVLLSVAIFVLLYRTNDFVAEFLNRFVSDDFMTGRDLIYKDLLTAFVDGNVLFGRGTASTYEIAEAGAHNIYIQILCDHGIVLSIPYFVLLIQNYRLAFKNKCPISIFIQTLFLVYGLSGNPLYSNMFMLIYVFGVLAAVHDPNEYATDAIGSIEERSAKTFVRKV